MHVVFQALSPLVPVRHVKFLRFCKQHAERVWAVVDVSIDGIREVSDAHTFVNCRRLPSGCIVEDMPNGFSKVDYFSFDTRLHISHFRSALKFLLQLHIYVISEWMKFRAQELDL